MSREDILLGKIVDNEYKIAVSNAQTMNDDFESYVDLLDSVHVGKDQEWESDISLPEFPTHVITQSSIDSNKIAATRDFTEVYLQDESDEAKAASASAKELINRTLNRRRLHHYHKHIRSKMMAQLGGYSYLLAWWEYEEKKEIEDYEEFETVENGEITIGRKPIYKTTVVKDCFNYEALDPRNVFTNNDYAYSMQDKPWVDIRCKKPLSELKTDEKKQEYFNLDKLSKTNIDTEATDSTTGQEDKFTNTEVIDPEYDIVTRYGKMWAIRKEDKIEPGFTETGEIAKEAEFLECLCTFAIDGGNKYLIGFRETPYVDSNGVPYKPIIRRLCYIHPTKDAGVGDGKYAREIQWAIDDTFNMSNNRTTLATIPVMKGKKFSLEDNSSVYIEPNHVIELNDVKDLEELKISDNIQGAMTQLGILTGKMQQVTAIFPTTMGQVAGGSTTATAVAGAEQRTNVRSGYKDTVSEYTCECELYWMIQQMTYVFAQPETGLKLMGEKVYDFDPTLDYFYKPVTSAIETEQSKNAKIQQWTQVLGYVSQIQHPDTVKIINYILSQMFTYMGDEFVNFGNSMLNPKQQIQGGSDQMSALGTPNSNQNGVPMSGMEQGARGIA